jgi:uncharacterized protein (TIGR03435 family)
MLSVAAIVCVTVAVVSRLSAQNPPQEPPSFEVASIRPSPDGLPKTPAGVELTPGRFRASFLSLKDYVAVANTLPLHQVSAPDWAASTRFDIIATFPDGAKPEQFPRLLQSLLVGRFGLRSHRESRETPVYALEVAAGGLTLRPAPEDAPKDESFTVASSGGPTGVAADLGGGSSLAFGNGRFDAKKVTMTVFAETLSRFVDRPVLNLTGLEGRFDVGFDVPQEEIVPMLIRSAVNAGIPMPPQALSRLDGASIVSVQDGLRPMGLSLKPRLAPLEILVVDDIRRTPIEN